MSVPTRDEWAAFIKQKRAEVASGNVGSLRLVEQASVSADHLTNDPHWDLFLRQLQAAGEAMRAQADMIGARIVDPTMVDTPTIMQLKIAHAEACATAAALDAVIQMPADIKANGDKARTLLERIGGPDNGE